MIISVTLNISKFSHCLEIDNCKLKIKTRVTKETLNNHKTHFSQRTVR